MAARFASNPYYVEYESQLKELSRLMAAGKGDTDEAEVLREALAMRQEQRPLKSDPFCCQNSVSGHKATKAKPPIYGGYWEVSGRNI